VPSATHKGFDPGINEAEAKTRWVYVIGGMVEKQWLKQAEVPTEYPKVQPLPKEGACVLGCGAKKPTGNVINYVSKEMEEMGLCTAETCTSALRDGGYRIKTSINMKMQSALESVIWRNKKGSVIARQKANMMAAGVAVDPGTGRVLAYFGGNDGTGTDYAGLNTDPATGALTGGHPPGSSFKIYTLAAALENDVSLDSYWDAKPFKAPGIKSQITNAGSNASCGSYCTLRQSTLKSYNVPFYHITEELPPGAVVEMAKAAGVRTMWDNAEGKAHDLRNAKGSDLHPSTFFHVLGYGAYPITVLDHANGLATIANRGVYNQAHFVLSVQQKDVNGEWKLVGGERLDPKQTIRTEVADDVNDVLQEIPRNNGDALDGRPATGKTGTWELREGSPENAHAWMIGATPQLATAIWVGNVGKQKALVDDQGSRVQGSGLPAEIWKKFMDKALDGADVLQFPEGKNIGDPDAGNGKSPTPTVPACDPADLLCIIRNGGDDRGGDNRGGGNGNGNGNDNDLFDGAGTTTTPRIPPPPG
jgi:membrane peptidoglycan carboxypeptidase